MYREKKNKRKENKSFPSDGIWGQIPPAFWAKQIRVFSDNKPWFYYFINTTHTTSDIHDFPNNLCLEEWFIQNPFSPRERKYEKNSLFTSKNIAAIHSFKKKFKWNHSCSPRKILFWRQSTQKQTRGVVVALCPFHIGTRRRHSKKKLLESFQLLSGAYGVWEGFVTDGKLSLYELTL